MQDKSVQCVVEWKERSNGIKPKSSTCSNEDLKRNYPVILCEFYESRIKSFPNIN
jgi:hypothetical protein